MARRGDPVEKVRERRHMELAAPALSCHRHHRRRRTRPPPSPVRRPSAPPSTVMAASVIARRDQS